MYVLDHFLHFYDDDDEPAVFANLQNASQHGGLNLSPTTATLVSTH